MSNCRNKKMLEKQAISKLNKANYQKKFGKWYVYKMHYFIIHYFSLGNWLKVLILVNQKQQQTKSVKKNMLRLSLKYH